MLLLTGIASMGVSYRYRLTRQHAAQREIQEVIDKWYTYGSDFPYEPTLTADLERRIEDGYEFLDVSSVVLTDALRRQLSLLDKVRWLRLSMNATAADLQWIGTLTQLRGLSLAGAKIKGADFSQLRDLQSLQLLDLSNTHISVQDFQSFPRLNQLQALLLAGRAVNDEYVMHLVQLRLPSLDRLSLSDTHITDVGLAQLCRSYNLAHLDLYHSIHVTNNAVEEIGRMTHLRRLCVGGTGLAPQYLWTPELDQLNDLLPKCSIDFGD